MNDVMYMVFMAAIGALISFAIMAFSKRAKTNRRFALIVQSICILGWGLLFMLGAGLQSPPGYPHWLIPIVFLIVLGIAHVVWRAAYPSEDRQNG